MFLFFYRAVLESKSLIGVSNVPEGNEGEICTPRCIMQTHSRIRVDTDHTTFSIQRGRLELELRNSRSGAGFTVRIDQR